MYTLFTGIFSIMMICTYCDSLLPNMNIAVIITASPLSTRHPRPHQTNQPDRQRSSRAVLWLRIILLSALFPLVLLLNYNIILCTCSEEVSICGYGTIILHFRIISRPTVGLLAKIGMITSKENLL